MRLLLLTPVPLVLKHLNLASPTWIFITAILAIIALAEWIRRATEQLPARASPAIGELLNVTFGNTAEFVLALFVLASGQTEVVKGQKVRPLLVLVSCFIGQPMNVVFDNPLELIAIAAVSFAVNAITAERETTWFEGILLLVSTSC